MPKFGVGILDDAVKKGDKEALDYYNVPVKHWTAKSWDELDMGRLDIGLHTDPTPDGLQARDRQLHSAITSGDTGEMRDMRIHIGNSLHAEDAGKWDTPVIAREAIYNSLADDYSIEFADRFRNETNVDPRTSISTIPMWADTDAVPQEAIDSMSSMRQWLLDNEIDTIEYRNAEEGTEALAQRATESPEWMQYEQEMLEKMRAAENDGNDDLFMELEDELELQRDLAKQEALEGNSSYISLDPGNVRNADANFSKENIGKAGMALGLGGVGVGLATGSQDTEAGILPKRFLDPDYTPENTQTAYKMFRTDGEELYPLFVDKNNPIDVGNWQRAQAGELTADGKVKSSLGPLAYRPGWHAGDNAAATHIGGKSMGKTMKAPDTREQHQVWAEVLMGDDFDWQSIANERATRNKAGNIVPRTAHITDQVPYGGSYRYKTNSNMNGEWLIGGDMKVNRVLSDEEVADINASKGQADLPRREKSRFLDPLLEKYGKPMAALLPTATVGALSTMSPTDAAASTLDVANRMGETAVNDVLGGSQALSNAMYGTDNVAPQVQFAPRTEAGTALSEGLMSDVGDVLNYSGIVEGMPSTADLIQGGMDFYNNHISPLMNDSWEKGIGGALLAGAWLLPGSKSSQMRKGDVERMDNLDIKLGEANLEELEQVKASDLIDRPYVSNMADTSAGDMRAIEEINGTPIENVDREGGIDYMGRRDNIAEGRLWSSAENAVAGIMNAAREAADLPGARQDASPLMLPWSMAPTGSTDFAQFGTDMMAQYARQNMSPADIKALDKRIRTGSGTGPLSPVPDWPGLMNATPELLTQMGGKRKNVFRALDEFRDAGSLSGSEVRHAISSPEAVDSYRPGQVLRVGVLDLDRGAMSDSAHGTYSHGVPGQPLGKMNPGWSVLDDESVRFRKDNKKSREMGSWLLRDRDQYQTYRDQGKLESGLGKAMQSNVIGVLDENIIMEMIRRGVIADK